MKGFVLVLLFFLCASCHKQIIEPVTWEINNTREVGGNPVTVSGNPRVINAHDERFVEFDGQDDGILINANPIEGMEEFTISVDFKAYSGYPENREQRFLHIQDPENENRRILIELRLNERDEWYGDWFIKSENENLTLMDSSRTHPVNEWATISLVYSDGVIKGYVNGNEEVAGKFHYLPIAGNAKTSIGTRMDQRSWFKGVIKEIRFTPGAHLE